MRCSESPSYSAEIKEPGHDTSESKRTLSQTRTKSVSGITVEVPDQVSDAMIFKEKEVRKKRGKYRKREAKQAIKQGAK